MNPPISHHITNKMPSGLIMVDREGRIIADAKLIRDGRRIVVADCDVLDSNGRLAAKGLLTYMRLDER